MPTISSSSAIRTSSGHLSLALRARHSLVAGTASENVRTIKGRHPADVDVILGSDLVIALSGTVDAVKIPGHVIQRSAVARHVLEHLRANEGQLGVSLASSIHVDQQDGRAKFSLTSSRPLRAATEVACLRLVSIDVELICKTTSQSKGNASDAASLFSGQAYLPLFSALDGIMDKFLSNDLVRKYPLIFGPWRESSDAEARLYPSLSSSLLNIVKSSKDWLVQRRLRRAMTAVRSYRTSHAGRTMQSLQSCIGGSFNEDDTDQGATDMDDRTLVSYALDRLYREGARPAVFKVRSKTAKAALEDEDEDVQIFDPIKSAGASAPQDLGGEETMHFGSSSDDDDRASLELSDDQQGSDPWPELGSTMLNKDTDSAEEEDSACIDLWDEDTAGYDSSVSGSLFCDASFSSSQSTLLDLPGLDDEICPLSPCPITTPSETKPENSQQNLEAGDEVTTGLSVWSHPAPCHHHSAWATHTQEPVHSDRDLLLDSDDDSVFPDDVATATRRSYDLSPSTSQFSYDHSELMDLDGDECDDASD